MNGGSRPSATMSQGPFASDDRIQQMLNPPCPGILRGMFPLNVAVTAGVRPRAQAKRLPLMRHRLEVELR